MAFIQGEGWEFVMQTDDLDEAILTRNQMQATENYDHNAEPVTIFKEIQK